MPGLQPAGDSAVRGGQAAGAGGGHAGARVARAHEGVRAGHEVAPARRTVHRQVRRHHQPEQGLLRGRVYRCFSARDMLRIVTIAIT